MKVIKPPTKLPIENKFTIFLAGSIEMGTAIDWQSQVIKELRDYDVTVLSPRRDDWDPTWEQTTNNENFVGQVKWELDGLEQAEYVLMYFDPNTKSPISLLELGLYADSAKLKVVCPPGFYRRGNVDIVCERYSVPFYDDLETCLDDLKCLYLHDKLLPDM